MRWKWPAWNFLGKFSMHFAKNLCIFYATYRTLQVSGINFCKILFFKKINWKFILVFLQNFPCNLENFLCICSLLHAIRNWVMVIIYSTWEAKKSKIKRCPANSGTFSALQITEETLKWRNLNWKMLKIVSKIFLVFCFFFKFFSQKTLFLTNMPEPFYGEFGTRRPASTGIFFARLQKFWSTLVNG